MPPDGQQEAPAPPDLSLVPGVLVVSRRVPAGDGGSGAGAARSPRVAQGAPGQGVQEVVMGNVAGWDWRRTRKWLWLVSLEGKVPNGASVITDN